MNAPIKIFGRPALMVPQPDGTELPYLITALPADPDEWRRWSVTGEDNKTYIVSEMPTGCFKCDCEAFQYLHRAKTRYFIGAIQVCKHCYAIARTEGYACGSTHARRPREGLARHERPDAPAANERGHNPQSDSQGAVSEAHAHQPAG